MFLSRFGMGARLFIAFLAITFVSLSSGVASWFILREISEAQQRMNAEALPAVAAATRTADATARLVATSSALDAAGDELSRAAVEGELARITAEIRSSELRVSFSSLDGNLVSSLSERIDKLTANLSRQNALVKERLQLTSDFTRRSEETIAAATAIVDVAETLVSNASAGASAVVANMYGLIDDPTRRNEAYDALDRLIEQDIFLLDRMSELRLRSSQIGLLANRLTRAIDRAEVQEIADGYYAHLRVVRRRVASIDDPVRRLQAQSYLETLNTSVGNSPWNRSLFSQRLRLVAIQTELEELAASNRNLSGAVGDIAQSMLEQSEGFAKSTADNATRAASTGLYWLVVSSLIAVVISGLIVWLYVERNVVRRLTNLTGAMQKLTDGDLLVDVTEAGSHELRALSRAVGAFRDESLRRRQLERESERINEELRRHRQELEALVKERTAQLQEEVTSHAEARKLAESASRAKSEFLATMSHEIRTPMTGMLGMMRVLASSVVNGTQRKQLAIAHQSGEALMSILNSILDYSKIESGKITANPVPFDLAEAVTGVIALMQPAAEEKGLTITLQVDPGLWGQHYGDGGKLRQIVFNLLSNAIKFTDAGSIALSIKVRKSGRRQQQIELSVSDEGVGISLEQQHHIFEAFTQSDPSITRRYSGTGLGLAISKGLAEAMGGALTVQSALGKGSVFFLTLPLAAVPRSALTKAKPAAAPQQKSRLANLSVLVVEDDAATRIVVQTMLEAAGHRVTLAEEGFEAIRQARSAAFDAVLMDISLPGMDGKETAAALRVAAPASAPPIIAMSAHVFGAEVSEFAKAGMDGYISKPLTAESLLGGIEEAIRKRKKRPGRARASTNGSIAKDLEALGAETVGRILDAAQAVLPDRFEAMRAALKAGDFGAIEDLAHATCSSAASAGFVALLAETRRLEEMARHHKATDLPAQIELCAQHFDQAIADARAEVGAAR
ncbi:MAG: ATP-binding protein [Paracoccaceae bacterium]